MSSLPNQQSTDSADSTKEFFDKYFLHKNSFSAAEVDAVVGFFLKRGFDIEAARSTSIVILNQAKIDNVKTFKLIDTLTGLSDVELSQVVTEILNKSRDRTSVLGYKLPEIKETTESRNIQV